MTALIPRDPRCTVCGHCVHAPVWCGYHGCECAFEPVPGLAAHVDGTP